MLYRLVWLAGYVPLRLLYRLRFVDTENLPRSGPFVVSGNHVSYLDPVLLALSTFRPISYMAKTELFEGARWFAWLLRHLRAFRVRRDRADREALVEAKRRLDAGGIVGIFPEGTRTDGRLGEAHGGAALVALRSGVPIVPVGIVGTGDALPRDARRVRLARVTIAFGAPMHPQDAPAGSRRERVEALTGMLMERIADALRRAGEEG
jgi:1-acyl-sn-glycerol-3-phosphate acyltransferase